MVRLHLVASAYLRAVRFTALVLHCVYLGASLAKTQPTENKESSCHHPRQRVLSLVAQ